MLNNFEKNNLHTESKPELTSGAEYIADNEKGVLYEIDDENKKTVMLKNYKQGEIRNLNNLK